MNTNTRFEDPEFVARWIAGELSPPEIAAFEAWIDANPAKQQAFDEMRHLWRAAGSANLKKGLGPEARWRRIQEAAGLGPDERAEPSRRRRWISWLRPFCRRILRLF